MFKNALYKINENYIYDELNKKLIIDNRYFKLSKKEVIILELLLLNRGFLVTKEMIKKSSPLFQDNIDVKIRSIIPKLRKKIRKDLIITIHSHGYVLINDSSVLNLELNTN